MASPTPRSRVMQALAFQESDIVPYQVELDDDVARQLAASLGEANPAQRIVNHLPRYLHEPHKRQVAPGVFVDDFGCVLREGANGLWRLDDYPLKQPSLRGYRFPDLASDSYFQGAEAFLAANKDYFTACSLNCGFADRAWMMRGLETFFIDLSDNPSFVGELLDALLEIHLRLVERAAQYHFDCLRLADDWGDQRGVQIGPVRWRKLLKPRLSTLFRRSRELGFVVAIHSCGGISEIIPDLIDMGVQIINPFQPEAMDVLDLKRRYGRHVCFNGGISTQQTLPRGSSDDVRREVAACIRLLGKGGGYVMAPAKPVMPDVPLANAVALVEAVTNQSPDRRYSDEYLANVLSGVYNAYHT